MAYRRLRPKGVRYYDKSKSYADTSIREKCGTAYFGNNLYFYLKASLQANLDGVQFELYGRREGD